MSTRSSNIGGKVKALAKVLCWVGIAAFVIGGIAQLASGSYAGALIGILTIAVGSLLSWVGSLTTYALGELVENSSAVVQQLTKADAERHANE